MRSRSRHCSSRRRRRCSVDEKAPPADAGVDAPPMDAPVDDRRPTRRSPRHRAEFSSAGAATFQFTSERSRPRRSSAASTASTPIAVHVAVHAHARRRPAHVLGARGRSAPATATTRRPSTVWTIDTVAPDTTLIEAPPAADNSVMVRFDVPLERAQRHVRLLARQRRRSPPCTSGDMFGPIGDGAHSFAVRARDRAGNLDASPAIYAWIVDTSTPDTQMLVGPERRDGERRPRRSRSCRPTPARARRSSARSTARAFAACTSPRTLHRASPRARTRSRCASATRSATSIRRRRRARGPST